MSLSERLRSVQVSSTTALLCIAALVCVSGGAIYLVQQYVVTGASKGASVVRVASPTGHKGHGAQEATATVDDAMEYTMPVGENAYDIISKRNLFNPLYAPAGTMTNTTTVAQTQLPPMPVPPREVSRGERSTPPDPSKNIAFTGVVTTPIGMSALLENLTTKETQYVSVSDFVFGFQVEQVTAASVTLYKDGSSVTLMLGENKPDDKPASAEASPGNGTQNASASASESVAQPGGTGRMGRPNLTPEQLEQFRQAQQRRTRSSGTPGGGRTSP